jgi:peptidoglycan/xylan/chitin deacetylase (PgdA/CDA1 family)
VVTTREVSFATCWRDAAQLPSGLTQRARRLVRDTIISLRALTHRGSESRFLRCLFCHYVFDDQREAFERVIQRLQRIGTFVTTDECIAMVRGERPIEGRHFHLSFDDGFRNNLTNAAPVLRRHGVPAAFFVPTSVIGADAATTRAFCSRIQYPATIELMTWDDVAELHRAGFTIGSHTRTHARFSDISVDAARLGDEIAGSKREIEARLGTECRTISWPFGKRSDADAVSLAAAQAAGYALCFGAYRGTVRPGVTSPFSVPRHHFEAEWPLLHIEYFARGNMERDEPEPRP